MIHQPISVALQSWDVEWSPWTQHTSDEAGDRVGAQGHFNVNEQHLPSALQWLCQAQANLKRLNVSPAPW